MQRILIVVMVLYVIWRVATIIGRRVQRSARGADDFSRFRGREGQEQAEALVECAGCGTMLPYSRSLPGPAGSYCSAECREHTGARPSGG